MMPNGLAAIIKKEFTRFFTDRRMVLTTILMPGLLIYLVYSFIGSAMTSAFTVDEDYQPLIYVQNLPPSADALFFQLGIVLNPVDADEVATAKQFIQDKQADLLVIFPEDFDSLLAARAHYTSASAAVPPTDEPFNIDVFLNSTSTTSTNAYGQVSAVLDSYNTPTITINASGLTYDLASDEDTAGFLFASLLPMLMMVFLYSGCIGVAPESIAGEKERGTIATLLVTPLRRWQLALGKVLSLGVIALLAGTSSFIGIMLSIPKILGGALGDEGGAAFGGALYNVADYAQLLAVILSTVLLFIGIIAIISAFARSVREASTMTLPMMIVVMLVGALAMFSPGAQTELGYYLIPAYNSVQCFVGVLSFTTSPLSVWVTVAVNLLVTAACVFALTKMSNSEKVIFSR
jgi:sodium transport system permease protein